MTHYRTHLREALEKRIAANARYSLRAFARDVAVSPSFLSQVLGGTRGLSTRNAPKVFDRLGLSPADRRIALLEVRREHLRSPAQIRRIELELADARQTAHAHVLEEARFSRITQWYSPAILLLLTLEGAPVGNRSRFTDFAVAKLALPKKSVRAALDALEEVGLIERENAGYRLRHTDVWTTHNRPSSAIRDYHRQMISRAREAIDDQQISERYLNSVQLPVRYEDLPSLDREIGKFRNRMMRKYARVPERDGQAVYGLTVQLFRMTKD